jgi:hypothetical protein
MYERKSYKVKKSGIRPTNPFKVISKTKMYKTCVFQKKHFNDKRFFPINMQTEKSALTISSTRIIFFDKTHINTTDLDSYEKIDGTVPCGSV